MIIHHIICYVLYNKSHPEPNSNNMFHSKLFANIDEEKRAAEEKYRILYFSKEVMETAISEINMNLDQSMPPVFAVLKRFADIGEPFQYGEHWRHRLIEIHIDFADRCLHYLLRKI